MTRTVHLARHGETVWHAENRYAGVSDVPLTARGMEQAAVLGRWASSFDLGQVVSSDLDRAVRTAEVVARAAGLSHQVDPALRESDFGRGEGMTRSEMAEEFPERLTAFLRNPATSPLPGGEAGAAAADRFVRALRRSGPDPTVVVAHTTVIRLALCRLLGLPLDDYRRRFPRLGNATVTTIELDDDRDEAALIRFNAEV